jgi:hypothetical protein
MSVEIENETMRKYSKHFFESIISKQVDIREISWSLWVKFQEFVYFFRILLEIDFLRL